MPSHDSYRSISSRGSLPVLCLTLAIPGLGVAAVVGGEIAAWVFGVLSVAVWSALAFLGARRVDRPMSPGLKVGLLAVSLWLVGCLTVLWGLRGPDPLLPWNGRLLGMPLAMAFQVVGVFVLPLPILAWLYARFFTTDILTDEDLTRLARLSGQTRASSADRAEDT